MITIFPKSRLILILLTLLTTATWSRAAVEISVEKTLKPDAAPVDVAVSADGRSTFVLTEAGNILVYDEQANLTDTIKVGPHVDQIEIDPSGERLFASSRRNKTVEIILLDFISEINTDGSPFAGPAAAPVIITVFSDFE
jgi:DNA-binding beta-propeller fold protein YncE